MCVPLIDRWAEALRSTLRRVYEPTTRTPVPWMLSGEAALAIQGVDADPNMIEFRASSPYAVAYFSGFMKSYEAPANAATVIYRRGGDIPPSDIWRSNVHQRIVAWSAGDRGGWLGRWNVAGLPVQVIYLRGATRDPISGLAADDIRRVHFEGMEVPVVPLEYLLADTVVRNQAQTTNRILHVLRASGYNPSTLQRALDPLPDDKASRLLRLLEIRLVAG
jgi:hypothetical protein